MNSILTRCTQAGWVLPVVLWIAGLGSWRSDASGDSWTGWRSELLVRDSLGAIDHRTATRLGSGREHSSPGSRRDSTLFVNSRVHEDSPVTPGCSAVNGQPAGLWGTDGNVVATARAANTLYIAGSFKWLGPNTGALVPLSSQTGAPAEDYAKVAGEVRAIAPDGRGGWFIGGVFNAVGGVYRHNLAHILSNGRVADWDPQADGADVNAIAVSGHIVYIGGGFTSIGGQDRRYIAAVDARTGLATPWNPWSSGGITSLVVDGKTVFAGGRFDSIAHARRENLVAIDAATGQATSWRMDAALQVDALLLLGDRLYAGGRFPWIGGKPRGHVAAIDVRADTLLAFDPKGDGVYSMYLPTPTVNALALRGHVLYTGGLFTKMGGEARSGLAAVDVETGRATEWNPGGQNCWARALTVHGGVIYVGGYFDQLGGQVRWGVGAVDRQIGRATGWNPTANGPIEALAVDEGTVFAGGNMSSMGPQLRRNGLAALDLQTGTPKAWNPNPVGRTVFTIALGAGALYAGGDFVGLGGQPRYGIGAVDTVTGSALDWHPDANGPIETIAMRDGMLYVGGEFTAIGGMNRSNLAAIDAMTGMVSDWNPACNGAVYSLATMGSTLYAAGYFARMGGAGLGGAERDNLAAIDATSGRVTAWNPDADSWANSVVVGNGLVYAGGAFNHVGGAGRNGLAAIDAISGVPTPWSPDADAEVKAVAVVGVHVYVGGYFQHVGGQPRSYLGAVDATTGTATAWNPHADASVWSLRAYGSDVYVGGAFTSMNGLPYSSVAALWDSSHLASGVALTDVGPSVGPRGVILEPVAPNPICARAQIRFALLAQHPTSLTVFDIQGRTVAVLLNHVHLTAGWHEVPVFTDAWPPGCYFCRLEAGGSSALGKIVVVK